MTRSTDFNLGALYAALDNQRQARGLSWSRAMREINRQSERRAIHPISVSTVTGLRTKAVAEGDGVLQMLIWLKRTPESFMADRPGSENVLERLPAVPSHQTLRFDTRKLYAALDGQRHARRITWAQLAQEIGLSVSSLTHLSKGGRTGFPQVMRIVRWLNRPAADFTRVSDW